MNCNVLGAFEELNMEEPLGLAAMDRDYDADSPTISNSISAGLASSGLFNFKCFIIIGICRVFFLLYRSLLFNF